MNLMTMDREAIRAGVRRAKKKHNVAKISALVALGVTIEHIADSRLDETHEHSPWNAPHVLLGLGTAVRMLAAELEIADSAIPD
ncbi:MAG: hypothetical protein ACYDHY_15800 [Acidiferrobacterales bacterium]